MRHASFLALPLGAALLFAGCSSGGSANAAKNAAPAPVPVANNYVASPNKHWEALADARRDEVAAAKAAAKGRSAGATVTPVARPAPASARAFPEATPAYADAAPAFALQEPAPAAVPVAAFPAATPTRQAACAPKACFNPCDPCDPCAGGKCGIPAPAFCDPCAGGRCCVPPPPCCDPCAGGRCTIPEPAFCNNGR